MVLANGRQQQPAVSETSEQLSVGELKRGELPFEQGLKRRLPIT